jgi:hypothetical protein
MRDDFKTGWKTFTEEIEVSGQQLLGEINRLVSEGNVHKLNIKSADGDVFLSIPLTAGVVGGGLVVLSAPWLAIIGGVAGLVTKLRLEVVRSAPPEAEPTEDQPAADKPAEPPPGDAPTY